MPKRFSKIWPAISRSVCLVAGLGKVGLFKNGPQTVGQFTDGLKCGLPLANCSSCAIKLNRIFSFSIRMSLSEISNEVESLSSLSQSSQSLPKVDLAFNKSLSNESIFTKKSFSFENQNRSLDLSNDDHLSTDQHSDQVEIGLPKILKFTNKISRIASRLSFDKYFDDEIVNQTQNFFRHTLDEYLNGEIICQFCQKSTFNWEDSNNCCSDYKEYVEGLIEHNRFQEALRQSITIDNFRSTAYMEEIKKKKALIQKRIFEIKKLERNVIKPKFKIKFDKPIRYNKVVKKQSIKPNESAAILTINKTTREPISL
ncbi:hypothetical protein BpHYR1_028693 [Brachionus plicatilis]|uniref:Uncharacterized protein n=1 Tax=Brachionus plicatilis TaxID=10195 RepID=A0A3M7R8Z6_BRAPC|nr:hypothetical protein BpHYR1_028693 [Brachionus plicatilis]